MIILLEKDPKAVARQAKLDRSRKRTVSAKDIAEHIAMNRMYAVSYSAEHAIPLTIITMKTAERVKFGSSKDAAKQIARLLEGL